MCTFFMCYVSRLQLVCGGCAQNSVEDLNPSILGYAGLVHEQIVGEEKYTFIEQVERPQSVSILIKGPNAHTIAQVNDAVRDGLRAVKNTIEDRCLLPGAGCVQAVLYDRLMRYKDSVSILLSKGKAKLGVQAFADALLIIPKTLALNAGLDPQDVIVALQRDVSSAGEKFAPTGIDLLTGDTLDPTIEGIWDNYRVHRHMLHSRQVFAEK